MKFSQMKYERPDAEQLKAELNGLTEKLKAAKSYTEAKELFLAEEKLNKHISTLANLAHIRHTIDTRDAFIPTLIPRAFWFRFPAWIPPPISVLRQFPEQFRTR